MPSSRPSRYTSQSLRAICLPPRGTRAPHRPAGFQAIRFPAYRARLRMSPPRAGTSISPCRKARLRFLSAFSPPSAASPCAYRVRRHESFRRWGRQTARRSPLASAARPCRRAAKAFYRACRVSLSRHVRILSALGRIRAAFPSQTPLCSVGSTPPRRSYEYVCGFG